MLVRTMRERCAALLVVALLGVSIPAAAQGQPPQGTPATGASVAVIDSAEIAASGARTLSELLIARVPGLSVRPRGGTELDGAEISSRGGIAATGATPLLIIDGIMADARQELLVPGTSVAPSRLDDLAPADIQHIEVLRGPAAGALYGFGAAGGVIVVTTRRPGTGPLRLDVTGSAGLTDLGADFPANYQLVNAAGQPCNPRVPPFPTAASCGPTTLQSWNPLEQASPFRLGRSVSGNATLSGATHGIQLAAGFSGERANGVTDDDQQSRIAMRGSAERALPGNLTVSAQGSYVRRDGTAPTRGASNIADNVIARGLLGSAHDDSLHGYSTLFAVAGARTGLPEPSLSRLTSALRLAWAPAEWVTVDALAGQDRTGESALRTNSTPNGTGSFNSYAFDRDRWTSGTMHVGATARYGTGARLALATRIAYDDVRTHDEVVDSITSHWSWQSYSLRREEATLRQHVAWGDVLAVDAGTRWSVGRGFSAPFGLGTSRNVEASLRLPSPRPDVVLHLRAAAGLTPLAPPGSSYFVPNGSLGFGYTALPNRSRQGEREAGIDAAFGTRARLEVTWFDTRAIDVNVGSGLLPPGPGGPLSAPLLADLTNRGVEVVGSAQLLSGPRAAWRSTVTVATLRSNVEQLSIPLISANGSAAAGYPLQGYWTPGYRYADANADGLIAANEVIVDQTHSYVGPSRPSLEIGLHNAVTLPRGITLAALLDYRGGQYRENRVEAWRCSFVSSHCLGMQDPTLSPADQARWAAVSTLNLPDVVPASFMRVREVVLEWSRSTADATRARPLAVRVVGQNLFTWTRYTGTDPEVGETPIQPNVAPSEQAQSPLPRRVRVEMRMAVM
jgi:TonB-dependent SusC/RagA subfamily outer membrane receptor